MTVREAFDALDYGPAPESPAEALAWLDGHGPRFGHVIGGEMTEPRGGLAVRNPATGATLAEIAIAGEAEVDAAVAAARAAQPDWAALGGHARARHLYALSRAIQKHARLLAVLEVLDTGKPIREARDIDVPLAARHLSYHVGMAQLMAAEMPGRTALGVCGQIVPWNFPLLMAAWKIAPALAAGNTVVLKPAEWTPLTALCLVGLAHEAGLPPGVLNVVTGAAETGRAIVRHDGIDKIAFTGSTEVGREIRRATAGSGKALTLELGGKSPFIVFDDADLDSAVEGAVDAIWFNQGQVCCAGSRLLVQESVAARVHDKLRARMARLRVGDPLDKGTDIGAMVDPAHRDRVVALVETAPAPQISVPDLDLPGTGAFLPPMLIAGLDAAHPLMREEIFGPVLVSATFRTPAEAVALANDTAYGLAASLWTENVNLALGVAPRLAAGVVWINGTNMFDAAAGFGGLRDSGFGREGGWEGMRAYTREAPPPEPRQVPPPARSGREAVGAGVDRTAKLYLGGRQTRPDGGYSDPVRSPDGRLLGHVPRAGRKDVRDAVAAARKAAPGWAALPPYGRAQILYYLAENLDARRPAFAARLDDLSGCGLAVAEGEVAASVARLFTYAAWADKFDGAVKPVPPPCLALALNAPVGVLAALCPAEAPLLGMVSVLGPALAAGNACVAVASEPMPLAATDLYQVIDTSDVPPGVVNILTGAHAELAPVLAAHDEVDALWGFSGGGTLDVAIETAAAGNLKPTWLSTARRDWSAPAAEGRAFLERASEVKTIWLPSGEG